MRRFSVASKTMLRIFCFPGGGQSRLSQPQVPGRIECGAVLKPPAASRLYARHCSPRPISPSVLAIRSLALPRPGGLAVAAARDYAFRHESRYRADGSSRHLRHRVVHAGGEHHQRGAGRQLQPLCRALQRRARRGNRRRGGGSAAAEFGRVHREGERDQGAPRHDQGGGARSCDHGAAARRARRRRAVDPRRDRRCGGARCAGARRARSGRCRCGAVRGL